MRWDRPILTIPAVFQVMSLSKSASSARGRDLPKPHRRLAPCAEPERSIEIQADLLGSDIVMQLDECVAWPAEEPRAAEAMRLSARWGLRSRTPSAPRRPGPVRHPAGLDLRGATPRILRAADRDRLRRLRIGGLAVGEGHAAMCEVLDYAPDSCPPSGRVT